MIGALAAIIALFCAAWLWVILVQFPDSIYSSTARSAEGLAQSAATAIGEYGGDDIDGLLGRLVDGEGYRITLYDDSLAVIGDSEGSRAGMTIREPGPELSSAIADGAGSDHRPAGGSGGDQVYAARRLDYRGSTAYVQVSTIGRWLNDSLVEDQALGLGMLISCLLASCLVGYALYRSALYAVKMMEIDQAKFVSNASHELKTPIAGIKLLSETILRAIDQEKPERIRECAERIDQNSDHLETIVNSLLETTRPQAHPRKGMRTTRWHLVDARDAVRKSFEKHKPLAHRKKLLYSLEVNVPDDANTMILVPEPSSTAIADNLIENAINYTSAGFVKVTLEGDGAQVVFSVSDSGAGMTQREQEMVFERYYRSQRLSSANPGGSGIGLALVKEAVAASGGSIELQSEPNMGSVFKVIIPTVEKAAGGSSPASENGRPRPVKGRSR